MNIKMKKVLLVLLCVSCLIATLVVSISANENPKIQKNETQTEEKINVKDSLEQEESVYVFNQADGNVKNIIVSDWIKGHSDQYQKYESDKDLPLEMQVKYYLDGNEKNINEIAHQNGQIEMNYQFNNNSETTIRVNGYDKTIKVPFVTITAVILDNEHFSDIKVEGGRLINDGNRTIIIGLTFPGLKDNLELADLDFNDNFSIKANVKDFIISNTMTLVTNDIFNEINLDDFDSIDKLSEGVNALSDNMLTILDGANKLYAGHDELLTKIDILVNGIDELYAGTEKLNAGAVQIGDGMNGLNSGIEQLNGALNTVSSNSQSLNDGSLMVFNTLISQANSELKKAGVEVETLTIENYAKVLNALIDSLDETNVAAQAREVARAKVEAAINANKAQIEAAVKSAVKDEITLKASNEARELVLEAVLKNFNMSIEDYQKALENGLIDEETKVKVETLVELNLQSPQTQAIIAQNVNLALNSDEVKTLINAKTQETINQMIEENMNSKEVQDQITKALEMAKSSLASISALKAGLDSYNSFYQGLNTYTTAIDTIALKSTDLLNGSKLLVSACDDLKLGTKTLLTGVDTIKQNVPMMVDGIKQLHDGSKKLNDGLKEFDARGIRTLKAAVDNDLIAVFNSINESIDASKQYISYTDELSNNTSLKFIYRTDAIK